MSWSDWRNVKIVLEKVEILYEKVEIWFENFDRKLTVSLKFGQISWWKKSKSWKLLNFKNFCLKMWFEWY